MCSFSFLLFLLQLSLTFSSYCYVPIWWVRVPSNFTLSLSHYLSLTLSLSLTRSQYLSSHTFLSRIDCPSLKLLIRFFFIREKATGYFKLSENAIWKQFQLMVFLWIARRLLSRFTSDSTGFDSRQDWHFLTISSVMSNMIKLLLSKWAVLEFHENLEWNGVFTFSPL